MSSNSIHSPTERLRTHIERLRGRGAPEAGTTGVHASFQRLHRLATSLSSDDFLTKDISSLVQIDGTAPWLLSPWLTLLAGERLFNLPLSLATTQLPLNLSDYDRQVTYMLQQEHIAEMSLGYQHLVEAYQRISALLAARSSSASIDTPIQKLLQLDRPQMASLVLAKWAAPYIEAANPTPIPVLDYELDPNICPAQWLPDEKSLAIYQAHKRTFVQDHLGGRPMLRLFADLMTLPN